MVENRPIELQELEDRGRRALEYPDQQEPQEVLRSFLPHLRLWHYPAFGSYISWTIYRPRVGSEPWMARQVQWNRSHDLQRFSNPLEGVRRGFRTPPTLIIQDLQMSSDRLRPYLQDLAQIPLLIIDAKEHLRVDGASHGVEIFQQFLSHARMEWWGDGPQEWQTFIKCILGMQEVLQQAFSSQLGLE